MRWRSRVAANGLALDPATLRTVQPHFTAAPIFAPPLRDPLAGRRTILVVGLADAADLFVPDRKAAASDRGDDATSARGRVGFQAYLGEIGGIDGFRAPLLRAIASFIVANWPNPDTAALKAALRTRIAAADPGGRSAADLARYASDQHLDEMIRWCRDREQEKRAHRQAQADAHTAGDEANRTPTHHQIWADCRGIDGTPAETYLVATRKIPRPPDGWPVAVAFHVKMGALVAAATTPDGTLQAVHCVSLTEGGEAERDIESQEIRRSYGPLTHTAVRLPAQAGIGRAAPPLLLVEGLESGLAVWVATGHETWIALDGLSKADPPASRRRIVVCRHDDTRFSPAARRLRDALARWRRAGLDVRVATPWPVAHGDQSSFADVMATRGPSAVRQRIARALGDNATADRAPPHRLPVDEARRQLREAVRAFFDAARTWRASDDPAAPPPPAHAIRGDLGLGKSSTVRRFAADRLVAMREAGDRRAIVLAVPTHRLGDEQAAAFESLAAARRAGLTAAVWRGRDAPDPDQPGERMCLDLARVKDALAVGARVQSACCRQISPCSQPLECFYFATCAYQRQQQITADLWIVPHELVFAEKPAIIGEPAAIIADEGPWRDGLQGIEGRPVTLPLDALQAGDRVPGHPVNTDRLLFLRRLVLDALRPLPDGPIPRAPLLAAGLATQAAAEARRFEWMRKIPPDLNPGMSSRERKAAVALAAGNATIRHLAMLWLAIEDLLGDTGPDASGWAALATEEGETGPVRVLHLKGRRAVRGGWLAPTVLIDATLDMNLIRPYWPRVPAHR